LSRATTLGNGDVNKSAIYFTGKNASIGHYTNLVYKCLPSGKIRSKYVNIKRRQFWIDRINSHGRLQQVLPSTTEVAELTASVHSSQIDEGDLDDLIIFHITHP